VLLLSNYPEEKTQPYRRWAEQRTTAKLSVRQVALENPPTSPAFTGQSIQS